MSSGTRSQSSVFQEMLDEAMRRIDTVEATQRQTAQENADLREQLDAARQLLHQQQQAPILPRAETFAKEPKVSAPETFHGRNKSKLAHFLLGVNIVLSTQPSRFPNDLAKINYTISYLRDDAKAWVEPFASKPVGHQPAFMTNFDLFVKELKTIFGDPDEVATAERQIRLLRQKGPASAYFADFRRYAAVLDWNDSALTSQAYVGLKDPIKDEFARTGRPETLDELITAATRIDNRLHEWQVERERTSVPASVGRPNNGSANGQTSTDRSAPAHTTAAVKREPNSGPASKRPSLTQEEKDRRRRDGLCLYCGSSDHLLAACPMAKPLGPRPGATRTSQLTSLSTPFALHDSSPQLTVTSPTFDPAPASALLDAASTCDYVASHFVNRHRLPLSPVTPPLAIHYADGSSRAELITHSTTIPIALPSGPLQEYTFYVTPLRTHDFFFGLPWHLRHRALIDFDTQTLTYSIPSPTPPSVPSNTPPDSQVVGPPDSVVTDTEVALSANERRQILGSILSASASEPALVPAQARNTSTSKPAPVTEDDALRAALPGVYHDFVDVFRKTLADELPPHRSYDHGIPLLPNTAPPFGPIYSLTEKELRELRSYLTENLGKGFIRPSSSSAGSPVLFVPKSDGSLRLCVDYRGLNNITVKDRYAIPKIDDLLDRIRGSTIFTKIDLRGAYNLLRIIAGEEWKTAFRTRFGSFEYLVMPFGLCNAPSSFQRFMNDIFSDMVDVFVVIYLDDILIFSKNAPDHEEHVKRVLERLRSARLFAKAEKCEFSRDSVEFLGYQLSKNGVTMVTDKVNSVLSWPPPKSVKELQSFLGFANFYRRFIWKYSAVVAPLTALLRKNHVWDWTGRCQSAFDALKAAFTSAPVLQHFDPSKPITLETDASDYAIAAVASQPDADGRLRPIAYRSRKMNPAELNYEIHDKEMLAIVDALREWRHLLQDSRHTVMILTDHKNLEYFTTSKMLNRRQARWAMMLTEYDFKITYRPGREGGKPDALTRRPDYHPGTASHLYADHNPHNNIVLLPASKHDYGPAAAAAPATGPVTASTWPPAPVSAPASDPIPDPNWLPASTTRPPDPSSDPASDPATAANRPHAPSLEPNGTVARATYAVNADSALRQRFLDAYPQDPLAPKLIRQPPKDYAVDADGLLLHKSRVYVPEPLRVEIIKSRHDHTLAGHPGRRKTLSLLRRDYFWPNMRRMVEDYVDTCDACARTKIPRHKPYGLLKSLPVPTRPWCDISMDFIEGLPISNGFDSILVIVDRLTKMSLFIPTHSSVTSSDLARLYLEHVFSKHGRPKTIVSDRGTEFTSSFWRSFCQLLDIEQSLSTAYHPQTDGQTERVNQNLEQYLRLFTGYQQDDWSALLPLAEFTYNNTEHSTTGCSPFFANKGYHPLFDITPERVRDSPAAHPDANDRVAELATLHAFLRSEIAEANEASKTAYDRKHSDAPAFAVGDQVMLSARNIRSARPTRKLDNRSLGPFTVIGQISSHAYRLDLPPSMHIHNVFHVSLLEPHRANTIPGRTQDPPPPVHIDGDVEYEVERIVDSKIDRRYACQLRYRVEWSGYTGEDRYTWEGADQLNCPRHVEDFHHRYPDKPRPA